MDPVVYEFWLGVIERYGLPLAFLVGFLLWFKPKMDQIWDIAMDLKKKSKPHETVEDVVQMNANIKAVLQDMMIDFRTDWCHLWQFHNGIRSLGSRGLPFLYITMTHEVKKTSLESLVQGFEHLPLSMFDDFVVKLIHGDIIEHKLGDVTDKMTELLDDYNVGHSLLVSVHDENGCIVAFISCSWNEECCVDERTRIKFRSYAQRMSATLAKVPDSVLIKN